MNLKLPLTAIASLALLAAPAWAYNPPVDTAGPLTVRIEGPELVEKTETPFAAFVVLENKGAAELTVALKLRVIDCWRVEPAEGVKFSVPAGETVRHEFKVVAGAKTYAAHYPIHAYASFQHEGKTLEAHPILITQAKPESRAMPAVEQYAEDKPLAVPTAGELALWQSPVRGAFLEVFGEKPQMMPRLWLGSEARTGGTVVIEEAELGGVRREGIGMHEPWKEGRVGVIAIEFPLTLPKAASVKLRFATGVTTKEGQGDGVTFRVGVADGDTPAGVLGHKVFDRHQSERKWMDGQADLTAFAGKTVRIQLQAHPGPKNDTSFDQSFWAEPTLVIGTPAKPRPFPPTSDEGSFVLRGEGCTARVWPGDRGLLDAAVSIARDDKSVCFRGFEMKVLGRRLDDPRSVFILREVQRKEIAGGVRFLHRFDSPWGPLDLVGSLVANGAMFQAKLALENVPADKPFFKVRLEDAAPGPFNRAAAQVYAGFGNVLRNPGPFSLALDGHRLTTSYVGIDFDNALSLVQAVDVPPSRFDVYPQTRRYALHAGQSPTFTFIAADDVWQAVSVWRQNNALKAAGGVKKLAGRFVFDLWGGSYAAGRDGLRQAFAYGLTDAAVVFHDWQRWGYDYRLPNIMPPNPELGTQEELRQMIEVCREKDVLFALHDNYIDVYPDADDYSLEKNVAMSDRGEPVKAWNNTWRGAQSYRFRAEVLEPIVRRNIEWIRKDLAPTAYFIDVWSSIAPYDYWTADGKYYDNLFTRDTWGKLFAWIRTTLGNDAPQISESGHDQLIGWLDGAQTNHMRVGKPGPIGDNRWCVWDWPCEDAERTAWFDAAHHDRFILHGAGYPGRYEGGLEPRLHGIYSDDYIATEVLTGHPAMVSQAFSRDVVRKYWLLSELMRALALRQIEKVEYVDGNLHRQHIVWSDGAEVWVNRGENDWSVGESVLPPCGFLAKAGAVSASITRRDGVIVEEARSPKHVYVNGRQMVDSGLPIRVSAVKLARQEGRRIELALDWRLDAPVPEGFLPFFHFCDASGEILFQGFGDLKKIPNKPGEAATTLSADLPEGAEKAGAIELRWGYFQMPRGDRLPLVGADDGTRRIRLGTIKLVSQEGKTPKAEFAVVDLKADPLLMRQNPEAKPIDFGGITTAAGMRLSRDGDALLVVPLPAEHGGACRVKIDTKSLPWKLPQANSVVVIAKATGAAAQPPKMTADGGVITLECTPDAFGYRLTRQ